MKKLLAIAALSFAVSGFAIAADPQPGKSDLTFKEPTTLGFFSNLSNGVFVPEANANGAGVIFLPTCSSHNPKTTSTYREWTKFLLSNGYTVAVVDYTAANGRSKAIKANCGSGKDLNPMRLIKDVYDAGAALVKAGVDSNKVFTVGLSLGAQIGPDAVKKEVIEQAKEWGPVPRAVVSLYGGCGYMSRSYLTTDINRPVLWMRGKADVYYNTGCYPKLFSSIKEKLPNSEFVDYEKATHCWDCRDLDGFTQHGYFKHTYKYNSSVTEQSKADTLRFLNKFIEAK